MTTKNEVSTDGDMVVQNEAQAAEIASLRAQVAELTRRVNTPAKLPRSMDRTPFTESAEQRHLRLASGPNRVPSFEIDDVVRFPRGSNGDIHARAVLGLSDSEEVPNSIVVDQTGWTIEGEPRYNTATPGVGRYHRLESEIESAS